MLSGIHFAPLNAVMARLQCKIKFQLKINMRFVGDQQRWKNGNELIINKLYR